MFIAEHIYRTSCCGPGQAGAGGNSSAERGGVEEKDTGRGSSGRGQRGGQRGVECVCVCVRVVCVRVLVRVLGE